MMYGDSPRLKFRRQGVQRMAKKKKNSRQNEIDYANQEYFVRMNCLYAGDTWAGVRVKFSYNHCDRSGFSDCSEYKLFVEC